MSTPMATQLQSDALPYPEGNGCSASCIPKSKTDAYADVDFFDKPKQGVNGKFMPEPGPAADPCAGCGGTIENVNEITFAYQRPYHPSCAPEEFSIPVTPAIAPTPIRPLCGLPPYDDPNHSYPLTVYLAGPMRGHPEQNRPAFHDAADQLRDIGYVVFNPAEDEPEWDGCGDELAFYLKKDLPALLDCDAVIVLPGWTRSQGAGLEVHLATVTGKPVFDFVTGERIDARRDVVPVEGDDVVFPRPIPTYPVEVDPIGYAFRTVEQTVTGEVHVSGRYTPDGTTLIDDVEFIRHHDVDTDCGDPTLAAGNEGKRIVTAVTGGQKETRRARPELLPPGPLRQVAELYGYGAEKYADRNWERGYAWSLSYGALLRHALTWWAGEDIDPENRCHHMTSVVFHALALLEFDRTHPELDDRP